MTLRERAIEETVTLADGREAVVRLGLAEDPYIPAKELSTITLDLRIDGELAATLNTVLDPDDDGEARSIVRELVRGLEDGSVPPTAAALEPFADRLG